MIRTTPNQLPRKKMKKIVSKENAKKKRMRKSRMGRHGQRCLIEKGKETKTENGLRKGKKESKLTRMELEISLRNLLLSFVESS